MWFLAKMMIAVALVTGLSAAAVAEVPDANEENILCQKDMEKGLVEPIPEPFSAWIVTMCTPLGQQLAPNVDKQGYFWFIHNTANLFVLKPQLTKAEEDQAVGELGAENLRFIKYSGGQLFGEGAEKLSKMHEIVFDGLKVEENTLIYQLDAVSSYKEKLFHLFFFIHNDRPKKLITCVNQCQLSVPVDILNWDEAKERAKQFEEKQ